MTGRRSKGVIIFGILLILGGLYQMVSLRFNDFKFLFQPLPERIILIRFYISAIMLILGVITGVGILMLKDSFRKIAIFIGFYSIYSDLIEAPIFVFRHIPKYIEEAVIKMASSRLMVSQSTLSAAVWTTTIIAYIIDLGFAISLIYFFSRSNVKGQFK